jgi:hypothetical protein
MNSARSQLLVFAFKNIDWIWGSYAPVFKLPAALRRKDDEQE